MVHGRPRQKTRHHSSFGITEIRRLLTRPGAPGALRRHRDAWDRLVHGGMWGNLAEYLGLGLHRWGPGDVLRTMTPRERWGRLQTDLIQNFPSGTLQNHIVGALLESLVFAKYGFVPVCCSHGRHWFISDDPRRKDCPEHRIAGQKARYREHSGVREKERRQQVERRGRESHRSGR
jgi:hypothetical protein